MKYTLLELTQNILSSMDSDEINSINDTPESQQVVQVIKTVYDDIVSRGGLSVHKTPFTLVASGEDTKPVLMSKPGNIVDIDWLKYNRVLDGDTDPVWAEMQYLNLEDFLQMVHNLNPSNDEVDTMTLIVNGFSVVFPYRNDVGPTYYTSIDDNQIVFDAFDSDVDSTLQASKTLGYGTRDLTFSFSDTFTPELQSDQFALLLNEAKSLAWIELKQTPHPKAEKTARNNWSHLARTRNHILTGKFNSGVHAKDVGPNFGRRV